MSYLAIGRPGAPVRVLCDADTDPALVLLADEVAVRVPALGAWSIAADGTSAIARADLVTDKVAKLKAIEQHAQELILRGGRPDQVQAHADAVSVMVRQAETPAELSAVDLAAGWPEESI